MQSCIACVQMNSQEDVQENLDAAENLIHQAIQQGAKLIILPEMFAVMGENKFKFRESFGKGPIQKFLHDQAKKNKIWIVGGTIPISAEDSPNRVFAACLLFNDHGDVAARYDKIHLFDVVLHSGKEVHQESQSIVPGQNIVSVPTPFGKLGLAVCYDLRFPEMFRKMQYMEIIALPSAFTYTTGSVHWDVLVRARAIENLCYVAAACQTGLHMNKRKTYGHSMIVGPWGDIKNSLQEETGVITANIDLEQIKKIRTEFPALEHKRI